MNKELSLKQTHIAQYYKELGHTRSEISGLLDIPLSLVKTRLASVNSALSKGDLPVASLEKDYPLKVTRDDVKGDFVESAHSLASNAQARDIFRREYSLDSLIEAFKEYVPPVQGRKSPNPHKIPDHKKELFSIISDLHIGKKSREFNTQTAQEVVERFGYHIIKRIKQEGISNLNLALIGDIIDGAAIFKSQVYEIDGSGVEQVLNAVRIFTALINCILVETDVDIDVIGVAGNHGVVSKLEKNADWENWEWLIYHLLGIYFSQEPRIKFNIQNKHDFFAYHKGVFFFHGHQISGGGNVEKVIQRCRQWATGGIPSVKTVPKVFVCGHFHRAYYCPVTQDAVLFMNGTASRDDSFIAGYGSIHTNRYWMFTTEMDKNGNVSKVSDLIPTELY